LAKSLGSNLLIVCVISVILYFIADSLHILPSTAKNVVSWGAGNFNMIVFLICFILIVYLIGLFIKRKGKNQQ
jgi:preprotein translocase subunit YajC